MAGLTAADVRTVTFARPGFGKRGYDPSEVDAFLDRVAQALDALAAGRAPGMSAADVHDVVFRKPPIGQRGYREDTVDDFLDRVAATLGSAGGGAPTMLNGQPLQP